MRKITFILSLLLAHSAAAELTVADIFTNHSVLQQGMQIPVWGTADAGDEVTISYQSQSLTTTTNKEGKWSLKLAPLKSNYESATLTIKSGDEKIDLTDVVVGEVWICSGQSNMKMDVNAVPDVRKLKQKAKHIRSFEVKRTVAFQEQENLTGTWRTTGTNSAVGFAFAYHLQQHADCPVGIIHASWGSSGIEAWMPRDMIETVPHFKTIMDEFDADKETQETIKTILGGKQPWSGKDDIFLRRQSNIIYNAMIHPLAPYACRGLVWYQGERNTQSMYGMLKDPWYSRNSGMLKYGDTLKAYIERYRKEWKNPEMHVLSVMLPGYHKPLKTGAEKGHDHPDAHSWAWMRESQLKSLELDHTAVVNTIDLGDVKNIHPKDKLPIGERLALLAARDTLAKDLTAEGPKLDKVQIAADQIMVTFASEDGLKTTDGQAPKSFWIADDSQNWSRATATLKGKTITLKAKGINKPLYVRYAFTGKPEVNLVNASGLPARPFRTDTFEPKP